MDAAGRNDVAGTAVRRQVVFIYTYPGFWRQVKGAKWLRAVVAVLPPGSKSIEDLPDRLFKDGDGCFCSFGL